MSETREIGGTNPAGLTGRCEATYSVSDAIRASRAVRDLFARRSRRVTLGTKLDGPLLHAPRKPQVVDGHLIPAPITKEEEAYLVAAAVGITGPIQADLPYTFEGGGRAIMNLYGRTIASPDAAHNQRLIVLNDAGTWFIKGPQDFAPAELPRLVELVQQGRWLEWYDHMRVRISERRAEIPRMTPYQAPLNFGSTNLPGTTYFLPIADVSAFCLNVVFSSFEQSVGAVFRDLRNGLAPAGIEDALRPNGPLNGLDSEMQGTVEHLSELIRGWTGNERGQMFANLARAAQELNLDGFPHLGGQLRAWGEELDFQMLRVPTAKLTRGSSKLRYLGMWLMLQPTPYSVATWLVPSLRRQLKRCVEVPLALEKDGKWLIKPYCPPFYPSMEAAVRSFASRKFGALFAQLEQAVTNLQPDKARALAQALERYTEEEIRRVAHFAQYCLDRYGVFPYCGEPGPLSSLEAFQVHVADPEYYRDHYRARSTAGQNARATLPLGDGTDVGEVLDQDFNTAPLERDGSPPWGFEADHILLLYDVPAVRVSPHLPDDFELVTHGKGGVNAELLVGFNHIVDFETKDRKWVPPYDEIMASVRVRHRVSRSEGAFYLKLHLDQRIPLDMGVVHFGYPKERAHIQRYERAGHIQYRAQQGRNPLYELEITPRERFGERLRAGIVWGLYRFAQAFIDPGATLAFFHRGDETLQTIWVAKPKASAMRFAKLECANFPFLQELKILENGQAQEPKLAMHSHCSRGQTAEAETVPSRVSRSVRLRLAWVARIKPLMDAIVRRLSR